MATIPKTIRCEQNGHGDIALKTIEGGGWMMAPARLLVDVLDDNQFAALPNFMADGLFLL